METTQQNDSLQARFKSIKSDHRDRRFYSYAVGEYGFEGYFRVHPDMRMELLENYELDEVRAKANDSFKTRTTNITMNPSDVSRNTLINMVRDSEYGAGNDEEQQKYFAMESPWGADKRSSNFKTFFIAYDQESVAGFSILEMHIYDHGIEEGKTTASIYIELEFILVNEAMRGNGFGMDLSIAMHAFILAVLKEIYVDLVDFERILTSYQADFDSFGGTQVSDHIESAIDEARDSFISWLNTDYVSRGGTTPPEVAAIDRETGF
ncbi:hypothetical protein AAE485_14995 (plasmid) [Acidithiobacillus ferriphilus]|uniref:hypothetical protein n=1 Tax=Acidithiobacillus TaxID=119977 RepID=UPI0034E483F2